MTSMVKTPSGSVNETLYFEMNRNEHGDRTFSQCPLAETSLRSNDGGSFMFITRTSMSGSF